jgi:plasmid stabilization system protein ParE
MAYLVRIVGRADEDTDAIFAWIASRSPNGAVRWHGAFLKAANALANDPERRSLAPESKVCRRDVRQQLFKTRKGGKYRILFTVVGNEVRVLRVRGPGQPPLKLDEIGE